MKKTNKDTSKTDKLNLAKQVQSLLPDQEDKTTRVTIKLPQSTHDLISGLAEKPRKKYKVFDIVIDKILNNKKVSGGFLKLVKDDFSDSMVDWIPFTYVISERSKEYYEKLAKKHDVKRDILINSIITQFAIISDLFKEEDTKKVEEALKIIEEFQPIVEDYQSKLGSLLGNDHPIPWMFGHVFLSLENCQMAIHHHLETGEPINPEGIY